MPRPRPPLDEGFGRRLRELMERERIRPNQLAKGEGVNPVTVSRWRRGEVPDDLRLPSLARRLRTTVEYLKTGVEGPTSPQEARSGGEPPSGGGRPMRAADRATHQVFEEATAKLRGRASISTEEAIGWLYRMLEARANPPSQDEGGASAP